MFGSDGRKRAEEAISAQLRTIEDRLTSLASQFNALSEQVNVATAKPRGVEILRKIGVKPDRFLERYFELQPDNAFYEALFGGSAPLRSQPAALDLPSSLCRQLHFSTDEFRFWMKAMGRVPRLHRKDWEWFYIAQVLFERGMLQDGKTGLGFAVGQEPLSSLFASMGCRIVATDQAPEDAMASGWSSWGMYSHNADTVFHPHICPREQFDAAVTFEHLDMNDIPGTLDGRFDFCWSSCALEHLGSLEHGLAFVVNSTRLLAPGGVAVHTTEFNLSSNDATMETPGCSVYRRRDMEELVERLDSAGCDVEPFDWSMGDGFAETVVDLPPYRQSPHIKLRIAEMDCTSIGIIIRKRM